MATPFNAREWSRELMSSLKQTLRPEPWWKRAWRQLVPDLDRPDNSRLVVAPSPRPPHFVIDLKHPAWGSTVEMDGKKMTAVTEVSVHASVRGLTEVKLTMYGTVKVVGADGVEVESIVVCPACKEAEEK